MDLVSSGVPAATSKARRLFGGAILILMFVLVRPLAARDSTDIVVMKNGDRLTGKIKRLQAGVLYFGLDYASGDVSIEWAEVARIDSKQLFIVKTEGGSVYVGNLATVAKTAPGGITELEIIETAEAENPVKVDKTQVVDVRQTSDEFWQRLSGGVSFGATYAKGNNATQYNLGADTLYRREDWSAKANVSSNLQSSTGATTSTRNMVSLEAQHLLPWENYFYTGLGNFLQSSVQGIQLQTSLGGGIGRFLKNTNTSQIAVIGGLAWQSTQYHQAEISEPAQDVVSALLALDVSLFRFDKTNLTVNANLFPALSDPGRFYFNTNVSYFVKIFGDIKWNISFYGNWDTKPPAHFSGSDYGTTAGLTWTFGK